jgi:hypothetical protein
MELQNRIKVL